MAVMIRPVKIRDISQLKALFDSALSQDFGYFPASYHRQVLAQNRKHHFVLACLKPTRILLGVFQEGKLLGYSISDCRAGEAFLFWIYLAPNQRKQGIGKLLLQSTEAACQAQGARLLQLATHGHHDYYQQHGFEQVGSVVESEAQVPMYIMEKALNATA